VAGNAESQQFPLPHDRDTIPLQHALYGVSGYASEGLADLGECHLIPNHPDPQIQHPRVGLRGWR
jgi:hypothetical protein